MRKLLDWLRGVWEWMKQQQQIMGSHDPTSWVTHWTICITSTLLIFLVAWGIWGLTPGVVLGKLTAEFWLAFFSHREGGDIEMHRAAGHSMIRYQWDRVGDLVGAILNDGIWWVIFWKVLI